MNVLTNIEKLYQLQTSIYKFVSGPLLEIQNSDICTSNKQIANEMDRVHTLLLGVNVALQHFRKKALAFYSKTKSS